MYKTIAAMALLGMLAACSSNSNSSGQNDQQATAANNNSSSSLDQQDKEFVNKAAHGGMFEVQAGQLAQQRAQSDQVKQFGQQMVTDHTQANDELKQLATQKGLSVPGDIGEKHQAMLDDLSKRSGSDFDKAYVDGQVEAHMKTVDLFQKEASDGQDQDLKSFASRTLPTLQHHLEMCRSLQTSMSGGGLNGGNPAGTGTGNTNNGGSPNGGMPGMNGQ